MRLSRRQFLQSTALLGSATLTMPIRAWVNTQSNILPDYTSAYLSALEAPYIAPLNEHFEALIERQSIGLLLYDVQHGRLITALGTENLLPVASAFKAPVLLYFVDVIDPAVWGRVPVLHWNAPSAQDVPEAWREDWRTHQAILRALYEMLVFSGNAVTGAVLAYVAREQGRDDPLVCFNDWARERVGISQLSALSSWNEGIPTSMPPHDPRFVRRTTSINGQLRTFENMMTPRDVGLFYVWALSSLPPDALSVCKDLLSTIHDNRGANLERLAQDLGGTPYSKNGSLIIDEGVIVTDAGIIDLPESRQFVLVMLSLGASLALPALFEELNLTLRGRYNPIIHNHRQSAVSADELLVTYTAHLNRAYPRPANPVNNGLYHYGFVLPEGVTVCATPDISQPVRNPIIRSTRFGVHLLMQGALVRFVDVNADWVELMPDDERDNVRVRLGSRLFVQRHDIWPITLDYSQPISHFASSLANPADKFVIVHLNGRELIAFEGAIPVMRVPIALNIDATPRGVHVITSKWFARSMQPWAPGVPFTCFFGSDGYALHGSPWQRWAMTVNQTTLPSRTSAGCVNIPDWMIQAGAYHRPADELLFRWIGGMENADARVFDYPSEAQPAIRIYNVDYLPNLRVYNRAEGLVRAGASWDDAIDAISDLPLQAPDSFFV